MEIEYLLFVLLGLTASIISAVFGFGTALIVLAVGSHIIPATEAIALGTVLFAASTLSKTLIYRKQIDWKVAGIMSLTSLPFAYLGASILAEVPIILLRQLLGIMILAYLALTIFNILPRFKIGMAGLVFGSATYGLVSGLLGSGNLIKVIIFREMSITKEAFVGAMAATSVLANAAKLSAYTSSGLLHSEQLAPMVALVIAAIAAVLLGRQFLSALNTTHFEAGLRVVLAVSALGLLL